MKWPTRIEILKIFAGTLIAGALYVFIALLPAFLNPVNHPADYTVEELNQIHHDLAPSPKTEIKKGIELI